MPYIKIDPVRCKGCGLCTIGCPKKLIAMCDATDNLGGAVAIFVDHDKGRCTGCALCAEMCPDVAICVFKE